MGNGKRTRRGFGLPWARLEPDRGMVGRQAFAAPLFMQAFCAGALCSRRCVEPHTNADVLKAEPTHVAAMRPALLEVLLLCIEL